MRVFLDANVLFTAAHNPDGKAAFIIELAAAGNWKALTCELGVEEARRNLAAKFTPALPRLVRLIPLITIVPTIDTGTCPFPLAEKDRSIFLSARQSKSSHLLTGDLKHFGKFMNQPEKTAGIVIQTVADFLNDL